MSQPTDESGSGAPTAPNSPSLSSRFDEFFVKVRQTGIVRPAKADAAGVCAGVARRFGAKKWQIQLGFLVLVVGVMGVGFLVYGLAWMLLPDEKGQINLERAMRGQFSNGFWGSAVMTLIGLPTGSPGFTVGTGDYETKISFLTVIGLGLGAYVLVRALTGNTGPLFPILAQGLGDAGATGASRPNASATRTAPVSLSKGYAPPTISQQPAPGYLTPPASTPTPPGLSPPVDPPSVGRRSPGPRYVSAALGLAALVGGVSFLTALALTSYPFQWRIGAAAAAVVIGLAIALAGLRSRRSGSVLVLTALLLLGSAALDPSRIDTSGWDRGADDRNEVFTTLSDQTYDIGLGDLHVDLRQAQPVSGQTPTITVKGGIGDVTIEYPRDLAMDVKVDSGIGDVRGAPSDGGRVGDSTGPIELKVDVKVGVGDVTFKEVSR